MMVLSEEERQEQDDKGRKEAEKGFVQRQEDEEYLAVCFQVRQVLAEELWVVWRYRFCVMFIVSTVHPGRRREAVAAVGVVIERGNFQAVEMVNFI